MSRGNFSSRKTAVRSGRGYQLLEKLRGALGAAGLVAVLGESVLPRIFGFFAQGTAILSSSGVVTLIIAFMSVATFAASAVILNPPKIRVEKEETEGD
ncbi:hypothetical protein [Neorhizobium sp. DAR64862/K0K3]|uniref:hypothetical protein n=1 Tax=Neorhizobium sp. DAR64862/K0K3 TaxID=3421957 RepID=UPI003D2B2295